MNSAEDLLVHSDQEIDLDRYAEVLAHRLHFRTAPSTEVLARLGVPEKRWNEAHAKWTRLLVDEAAEDEAPTARQFGAAFAQTRARLREQRPTIESLGSLPVVETALAAESVFAVAERAPLAPPPPVAVALLAPRHPVEVDVALPSYLLPASPHALPPLAPLPALPSPICLPARVAEAPLPDLRATVEASDFPGRPTLPFQAGRTSEEGLADVVARMTSARGAPQDGSGKPSSAHLGETVGLAPFAPGGVLPFSADAAAPAAPSWMPAGMMKLVSVEGTQLSTDAPTGPALPFEPAKSSQIALGNALTQAARLQGPAPGPGKGPALAGTMGPGSSLDLRKPELPFSSPSAPIPAHIPAVSMERYASLCVELSATPANAAHTLRRYQLTEPEWSALDAEWKARLAREPGARAAWESACSAYRTWLAEASRRKT